jgi:hypothetical protein
MFIGKIGVKKIVKYGVVLVVIVPVLFVGGYTIYSKAKSLLPGQAEAKTVVENPVKEKKPDENLIVTLSDEDFGEVEAVQLLFGYKGHYSFKYGPERKLLYEVSKNDGLFEKVGKSNEKKLKFKVSSITLLGYDGSEMSKDDFQYQPSTKTLYVNPPRLQMITITKRSHGDMKQGVITALFDAMTLKQIDDFYAGADKEAQNRFKNDPKEIEKGYEFTNNAYKELILKKNLSVKVDKVVFRKNYEEVNVINDELSSLTYDKKVKPTEVDVPEKKEETKK